MPKSNKPTRNSVSKFGSWAFLLGVLVAVATGVVSPGEATATITSLIIVLGLIAGLLNVTQKETTRFLIATVALVIVTSSSSDHLAAVQGIGPMLQGILNAIQTFVVPAAIVVAIKSIFVLEATE